MNKKFFIIFLILFFNIFNYAGASTFKLEKEEYCLLNLAKERLEMNLKVISRVRSFEVQDALWAQSRCGNSGAQVTNAKAGESYHNFGYAFDISDKYIDSEGNSVKINNNQ